MPWAERLAKDIGFLGSFVKNWIRAGFRSRLILVYPHYPSRGSTFYKIARQLGYTLSNRPDFPFQVGMYWEYLTFREEFEMLEQVQQEKIIVNLHSRDISKLHVDEQFKQVFGYSSQVNPMEYEGLIVKKNDINAKHDGHIIQGPISKEDWEEGYIYQLLIDSSEGENTVIDLRVPVVGTVCDFVYKKYVDKENRFAVRGTRVAEIYQTNELFTQEEIELMNQFCKNMHFDFGEMDVMRHRADGKIYIIDVNNTPQGPPKKFTKEQTRRVLTALSESFHKAFIAPQK